MVIGVVRGFSSISLDRLRVGLGWFRGFCEFVLDVTLASAVFIEHLVPLLVVTFLAFIAHCAHLVGALRSRGRCFR